MKKTTVAGVGLAAAAALPSAALAAAPEPKVNNKQQGYQVTQHVVDYYKSLT